MPEEKITAPLSGTVLSVKKKAGDKVNLGDIVLIVDAMKMENEILAPRKGVIKDILACHLDRRSSMGKLCT